MVGGAENELGAKSSVVEISLDELALGPTMNAKRVLHVVWTYRNGQRLWCCRLPISVRFAKKEDWDILKAVKIEACLT